MTTTITICDTCKRAGWEEKQSDITDGQALAELVEAAAGDLQNVKVRRHSCLMGCDFACNVTIQAKDKLNYVIGTFEPSEEAAEGIVNYATLHAASDTGQVPYREWPQAIKGHFRARIPLLPQDE